LVTHVGQQRLPIYYEEYGEGKPVLCIHGHSVDHRLMTGCLEPIFSQMQGYRRIYLDLPGMGRTPAAAWLRTGDDMLALIADFIAATMPDENFLIAGESYGGYMSLGLIRAMGTRIDGVLLICPAVIIKEADRKLPEKCLLWKSPDFDALPDDAERDAFLDVAAIATPEIYRKFQQDILPGIKAGDVDFLSRYVPEGYGFAFEGGLRTVEFHKPMSIITGRQDHWVGYEDAFKLLERCSRATFAALDCGGHNLQIENEPLFRQLVTDWLWRVSLGA